MEIKCTKCYFIIYYYYLFNFFRRNVFSAIKVRYTSCFDTSVTISVTNKLPFRVRDNILPISLVNDTVWLGKLQRRSL